MKITRKAIATLALVALPVVGALGMQPASAEDNAPAPKASCTWGGVTTSDGGTHTETGPGGWSKYKCVNGSWVLDSSCSGNCNPPPPKVNPKLPKTVAVAPRALARY